jgi:hypothetical protein
MFNRTVIVLGFGILAVWLVAKAVLPEPKMECIGGYLDGKCVAMRPIR